MEVKPDRVNIARAVIFVAALGFLALGIYFDGLRDVWSKASMICMECIGIG